MSPKTVLLVVFNHRYDQNLPVLRSLYAGRFSNVYFLVPFYDGNDEDVIPVYSSSDTFQTFLTYAYSRLKDVDFDYWFVVADDMIINPELNETNVADRLQITPNDSYTPVLQSLNSATSKWGHSHKALKFVVKNCYVDVKSELPPKAIANQILEKYGVSPQSLDFYRTYRVTPKNVNDDLMGKAAMYGFRFLDDYKKTTKGNGELILNYPLCYGYCDIFCIGKHNIKKFVHYCGVFGATNLFVEIAIPTSIAFATAGIVRTNKDIHCTNGALWGDNVQRVLGQFDFDLRKLINNFPKEYVFLHPVKLSMWK